MQKHKKQEAQAKSCRGRDTMMTEVTELKVAQDVRIKAEAEWKERMEQESIRVAAETVQLEVKLKAEAVALAATFKADADKLKEQRH